MILKHRDVTLLRFEWRDRTGVRIVSVNDSARRFLPLEMKGQVTDEALWSWLRHRTIPSNRRHVEQMLASAKLDRKDVRGIIELCRGLSLNDVYWVVGDQFTGAWANYNLYRNRFSSAVATLAFNGSAATPGGDSWSSSPEWTTNGMLAKCWRRVDGEVKLYKTGSEGAANAGFEPYSEYYAAQLADAMGLPHVTYDLAMFKGHLCSTCPLFTSERLGYLPASRWLSKEESLSEPRFSDIFFFDALIFNSDRHLGNFGYLVDNDTNEIVGAAPIFDNGYGLFSRALDKLGDAKDDFADLRTYLERVHPSLLGSWLDFPGGLTPERRARLKRLEGFRFRRHRRYNLNDRRLFEIEVFLQRRISQILDYGEKADELLKIPPVRVGIMPKNSDVDVGIKENLKADPYLTAAGLAEILNVTQRTIERRLKALKARGEIERQGARKRGSWIVRNSVNLQSVLSRTS